MSHQESLFDKAADATRPLAARMRPETLDEVVGQEHLISEGKILRRMIESDQVPSMIFWGPPGVGKTTLARVIAHQTRASFIDFSAVTSGIKEIRDIMKRADAASGIGARTIVFIDEIHRFNKAQQDAFLPFVEKGAITLIGATTENPSFEVNGALLSRCKVFVLKGLLEDEIMGLLRRALEEPRGFGDQDVRIEDDLLRAIAVFSNGDARSALSILEMVVLNGDEDDGVVTVTEETVAQCTSQRSLLYDKAGEEHYNIISALHKSMRNSDPDASVYWLARMLESGEDPVYLARRITRFAAEDIGLADTNALAVAINAFHACHFIGMPECTVHLAEAVIYLSMAPKSNSSYIAYEHAKKDALHSMAEPVPLVIRNAPTRLMKDLGYGEGYRLAHDEEGKVAADMQCLPDSLVGTEYYTPTKEGHENRLRERLIRLRALRQRRQ
ncbi:replication-associated recombination protein A [Schaalia cardiffensis]|uniref:replication-associated recombination protein A n=1 Tax=Schaalia cardiffensis TaxID=181487 RepID=UPI0018E7C2C1|nr:replication-associated recombination protein A [Schaalia cardiffensis]MBJ2329197.1 replication-associated recombination protein A [Schaalia cardiffensis]